MKAPLPTDEAARLKALREYEVLDTPPEPDFDDIATLAAQICAVPVALITLIDEKRQWFKSRLGFEEGETSREVAFCAHAILKPSQILEVPDATKDRRFADNPLVQAEPGIRFYAGAPLVAPGGHALGTLCVLDRVPRELSAGQRQALATLGRHVMVQLELRRHNRERARLAHDLGERVKELRALHGAASLLDRKDLPVAAVLTEVAGLLAPAMQHVGIAAARAEFDGEARATGNFRSTPWRLESRFAVSDGRAGRLEVVYLEEVPAAAEGPFLAEERHLLDSLAEMLRSYFERQSATAALADAQRRQRLILDSVGEGIFGLDRTGRIMFANPAGTRMLGWGLGDLLGRDSHALIHHHHPDGRPYAAENCPIYRTLQDGALRRVEDEHFFRHDGAGFPVEYVASPVHDESGAITGGVICFREITERKQAESRLRESEERFRLLARATLDAVWDWDLVADKVWWNEGYESLFGYRRDEVAAGSRSWTDYIHPEDLQRVMDGIHAAIDGGGTEWSDDYRFRRKAGDYVHVFDRGHVIRDGNGKPVRMIGGMTDLTERREADRRLREQAELLDKARDAILVRDLEHRVTYWNKGAERVYGWTMEEVRGKSLRNLLHFEPSDFDRAMQLLFAQGEWMGELVQQGKEGRLIQIEGRWTLLRDAAGNPISVLAIDTDITERKKLEQQFLRNQRMESIGTLAGGIAHDLNNLLAPITMGVELLRRNGADAQSRLVIDNIERSAKRGASLVKQVLSFARGVEGSRVPLQPRHLLREVESIIENTFPKNITLSTELAPDLWPVVGDPTQVHQVLLNLCVNARDAMPGGGRLEIAASNAEVDEQFAVMNRGLAAGRYVVLTVSDTGCGIDPALIDRVFEPFFTTKEIGKGTGLGLSTVLGIVRSHGGFVKVQSEPGRGSSFRVYLPAQPDSTPAGSVAPFEDHCPRGDGELILVVDDEASIRSITRQTLETFGYKVITAEDGAQAIGLFADRSAEIALVLTDMMMPVMDGPALIAALRRLDPAVRIIAASGLSANGSGSQVSPETAPVFLPKPYSADTLLAMIRRVLSEKRDGLPPDLDIAG